MNQVNEVAKETTEVYLKDLQEQGVKPQNASLGIEYHDGKMQTVFHGSNKELSSLFTMLIAELMLTKQQELHDSLKKTICTTANQFAMADLIGGLMAGDSDDKN